MMYSIWKNPEKYNSYFIGDWYVSGDSHIKMKMVISGSKAVLMTLL